MALISTTSTDADGVPSGEYVFDAITSVNLRASHTIMCRVKHGLTTTNYHSVILAYIAQADLTGGYIGRDSGAGPSSLDWTRQAAWPYARDEAEYTTCYGDTSTWYHVTFVYNATTQMKRVYIDGAYIGQQASTTTRTSSSTANQFIIGAHNGKFADAALFNRALSDSEVADMAAYRVPQVTSGLVTFWRLDANATDSSGNGNNGAESGGTPAVSWSTADNPPQPETPTVAMSGTAASSSGFVSASALLRVTKPIVGTTAVTSSGLTGQLRAHIAGTATTSSGLVGVMPRQVAGTAASSTGLTAWIRPRWGRRIGYAGGPSALARASAGFSMASPWTVMVWLKPVSFSTDGIFSVFGMYSASGDNVGLGVQQTSGVVRYVVYAADSGGSGFPINYIATNDGDWHHAALTYDGTTARAYIDGSLVASASAAITGNVSFFNFVASNGALAEYAHAKGWAGAALSASDIASEATYYTPHHNDSQVWMWWQLAWDGVLVDSSGKGRPLLTDNGSLEAQHESPGEAFTALAGTLASSTGFPAAALVQSYPLAGALASSSGFPAAVLNQTFALAGTAASSTGFPSATLTQVYAAAGTPLETESEFPAALLTTLKPMASSGFASSSGLTGALIQAQPLTAPPMASSSEFTGAMLASVPLTANVLASASEIPAAALALAHALTGPALTSQSALSGNLGVTGVFSGLAVTESGFPPPVLDVERTFSGTATSSSQLQGTLIALLSGEATTGSELTGITSTLFGDMGSQSAFQPATLDILRRFEGDATTTSALVAALTGRLFGSASSASTFTGNLSVSAQIALTGEMDTSTSLGATMSGGTTPVSGGAGGDGTRGRVSVAAGTSRRHVR